MIRPYHDIYILAQSAYNIKEVLGKAWVKGRRRLKPLVSLFHPRLKYGGYQAPAHLLGMVESQREMKGKVSIEQRYYILSLESDVHRFAAAVRSHWSVENQLHWILDVGFSEDYAQSCSGYSAENLAVIRHIGINLLSTDKESKVGVKTRRLQAGWDDNYLKTMLSALNIVTV